MTAFDKARFQKDGDFLFYGEQRQFIARFKRNGRDRAGFISFLCKNFTVEEYVAAYKGGTAPAEILRTKGYVSATVKRILRDAGYPQTQEGFKTYITDQIEKRSAA